MHHTSHSVKCAVGDPDSCPLALRTQVHSGAQEYANAFLTEGKVDQQPVKEVLLLKEAYRLAMSRSQLLILILTDAGRRT